MTPRVAARLAWSLWATAIVLSVAGFGLAVANRFESAPGQFGPSGLLLVLGFSYGTVGAVVAARRPSNPIGWLFLATGVATGIQEMGNQWAIRSMGRAEPLPLAEFGAWLPTWIWVPITLGVASFLFLLFPTGHPPTSRWRVAGWVTVAGIFMGALALALTPGPLENFTSIRNPFGVSVDRELMLSLSGAGLGVTVLGTALSLAALVVRYRRSSGDERAQMKWLMAAAVFIVLVFGVSVTLEFQRAGADVSGFLVYAIVVLFFMLPVATGIAILKYRLWDIDVVINRAVVYGTLAAFVTIDYVAIVVGVGALVGRQGSPVLTAAAAALAAITFQPLRRRLQHFANRLVYGERATPYEVLSDFAGRLGGAYAVEDVLPRMARAIGEGTGAVRAEVQLRVGGALRTEAVWPADAAEPESEPDLEVPVTHQGADLGALAVWKGRGQSMTPVEEKLVRDLAAQAGLVVRNVRLLDDLRDSRRRLVSAQDAERRRLERDIHDGAQQHLVALAVKLRLMEGLIAKDAVRAAAATAELKEQANDALETLRELARGIYPPLLADQGLAAALDAQARRAAVPVEVHPDGVGRHPQEVEAAVYFCALEALQNVAKYAEASKVDLTLRQIDGHLEFEVRDDGRGFDPATTPPGSGLVNMRDRLEALGGSIKIESEPGRGTRVIGRLPVLPAPVGQPEAAAQASSSRSGSNSDLGM